MCFYEILYNGWVQLGRELFSRQFKPVWIQEAETEGGGECQIRDKVVVLERCGIAFGTLPSVFG